MRKTLKRKQLCAFIKFHSAIILFAPPPSPQKILFVVMLCTKCWWDFPISPINDHCQNSIPMCQDTLFFENKHLTFHVPWGSSSCCSWNIMMIFVNFNISTFLFGFLFLEEGTENQYNDLLESFDCGYRYLCWWVLKRVIQSSPFSGSVTFVFQTG